MLTRRRVLGLLAGVGAMGRDLVAQREGYFRRRSKRKLLPAEHPVALFGTDTTKPGAHGIYAAKLDPATGQFSQPVLVAETPRPAYFAINQQTDRQLLYVGNEGADAKSSTISTFLVDPATGGLKGLGQVAAGGAGPCYVSVDGNSQLVFAANYMGGSIASFRVKADGTLDGPVDGVDFRAARIGAHGPNGERQDGPHPHSALLSPDSRFLLVNDLGNDQIVIFPVDQTTGKFGKPKVIPSRIAGSGPRHLAFHPNERWVYGIDELSSKINQFLWSETRGASATAMLTDAGHSMSTVEAGFHGLNTAAEIEVSGNGYFLYASNRGEDSLVVFAINQGSGALTGVQRISCGGKTPRHFTIDPTGKWLVCGNQGSGSITVFARDEATGMLRGPVQTLAVAAPMFTLFV